MLEQLPCGEAVCPNSSLTPTWAPPPPRPTQTPDYKGLLGLRPGQEGVQLQTPALGSVWDPEMTIAWADCLEGDIFRVLKLCPTLSEISCLGSTVRDAHAHPGHTTSFITCLSSSYLELVAKGRLLGESGSARASVGLSSPSWQVLARCTLLSHFWMETDSWSVSSPFSPFPQLGNQEGGARGSGFQ